VVISDASLVEDLFSASRNLIGRASAQLDAVLGPESMFKLDGDELLERRRLLLPRFHSSRERNYEHII
jgi:cytochrome P450